MRVIVGRLVAELNPREIAHVVEPASRPSNPLELEDEIFHTLLSVRERIFRNNTRFSVPEVLMLLLLVHRLSPSESGTTMRRQLFTAGFLAALDKAGEALFIQVGALGEQVLPFLQTWEVAKVQGPLGTPVRIDLPGGPEHVREGMAEADRWPFLCGKFSVAENIRLLREICEPGRRGPALDQVNDDCERCLDRLWGLARVQLSGSDAVA